MSTYHRITPEQYAAPHTLPIPAWYFIPENAGGFGQPAEQVRRTKPFEHTSVVCATHWHPDSPTAPTCVPEGEGGEPILPYTVSDFPATPHPGWLGEWAEREIECLASKALVLSNENAVLRGVLVMLKRELDDHVTDPTKLEIPKSAWQEAMNRVGT